MHFFGLWQETYSSPSSETTVSITLNPNQVRNEKDATHQGELSFHTAGSQLLVDEFMLIVLIQQ